MKFFDLRKMPIPYSKYVRQLWLLNPPVPEIVIGNNTALFATLASLAKHGKHMHPNLRLICPEYWLDKIHPYYLDEKWGQTKTGLPKVARELLANIYPNQATDNFLSLRQIQTLRYKVIEKIENDYNVPIYFGEPSITKLANNQFEIKVKHKTGENIFHSDEDTRFYFWYRISKQYSVSGVPQKPNTDIYQLHPSDIPDNMDIVTLGGGLSVIWLAKHFANASTTRKIICIKHNKDSLKWIPSNGSVDPSRIIILDAEKTDIRVAEDAPNFAIVYSHEYKKEFRGAFYTSIGSRIPEEIVKEVPESQVMSPSKWIASKWIATKNVPPGSLMESILQWFEITDNLKWGFEPQNYHENANQFLNFVKSNCSQDLQIDASFFNSLESAILMLDNPLADEQVRPFLIQIYQKVYHPNASQLNIFSKSIDQLLQQTLVKLSDESPTPEFSI